LEFQTPYILYVDIYSHKYVRTYNTHGSILTYIC
jgi:hypothetical protein